VIHFFWSRGILTIHSWEGVWGLLVLMHVIDGALCWG
jgi:hypothetical protein